MLQLERRTDPVPSVPGLSASWLPRAAEELLTASRCYHARMAFGRRPPTSFEKRLGYRFKRPDLLELAAHPPLVGQRAGGAGALRAAGVPGRRGARAGERRVALRRTTRSCRRASFRSSRRSSSAATPWRSTPRRWSSGRRSGSGWGRTARAGGPRPRSSRTPWRRFSARSTSTAAWRRRRKAIVSMLEGAWNERDPAGGDRRQDPAPGGRPGPGLGPARVPARRLLRAGPQQGLRRRVLAGGRARRAAARGRARRWRSSGPPRTPCAKLPECRRSRVQSRPHERSHYPPTSPVTSIRELSRNVGQEVELRGMDRQQAIQRQDRLPPGARRPAASCRPWPAARTSPRRTWADIERVTQESTVRVRGTVKEDKRSPIGVEIQANGLRDPDSLTQDYPDHAQGARHGVPHGAPPPLAALQPPARGPAGAQRGRAGDPRLLLRARVHPHRLADPHPRRLRGDLDAVRDRLLRRQGLPLAVRPALPRAGRGGPRQGLLLRPHLPRREVEDPPPPDGVLDGRARGGLPGVRGALRARRGVRRLPRRRACSTARRRS